jgi:hypothetical protein
MGPPRPVPGLTRGKHVGPFGIESSLAETGRGATAWARAGGGIRRRRRHWLEADYGNLAVQPGTGSDCPAHGGGPAGAAAAARLAARGFRTERPDGHPPR